MKAFLLGAGLGTRLRPLTNRVPKPLVPFFDRPLIRHAFDACRAAGCDDFAINTHHLPAVWQDPILGVGASDWQSIAERGANGETVLRGELDGCPLRLFHEPLLLETGGGLRNVGQWMSGEDVLVHNGDIFSTMDLQKLIATHKTNGCAATLALRSQGTAKHIAWDPSTGKITDIRGKLSIAVGTHVFSGVYCIHSSLLDFLPNDEVVSVIPAFLELIKIGKLGAVLLDQGDWFDLGERESYLDAHRLLALPHPQGSHIAHDAIIEHCVIGKGASIGHRARLRECVVWPGGIVADDADLERCIIYSSEPVLGSHRGEDL